MIPQVHVSDFLTVFSRSFGKYKKQVLLLGVIGFVNGILGGVGISIVIPLFSFVTGDGTPGADTISRFTHAFFAFVGLNYSVANMVFFIIALFISKSAFSLAAAYVNYRITLRYQEETRLKLFRDTLAANWTYLLTQKMGHIETVLMKNIEKSTLLLEQTVLALMLVTTIIAYAIVAFSISAQVTIGTFVVALVMFFLLRSLPKRIEKVSTRLEAIYRDIAHQINESILAMKTIKARGVEDAVALKNKPLAEGITRDALKIRMGNVIPNSLLEPVSIILVVGIFLFTRGTPGFNIAALAAVIYVIKQIFSYLMQVQNYVLSIRELTPYARMVLTSQDLASEHKEVDSGTAPFHFSKELSLEHISFTHNNGKKVFDNLTFQIKKGEFVGIIGASGAGKTTLVDLLLRLFVPSSGTIKLDDIESSSISKMEWRSHIGYVPQEVFLLNGTIRENVKFFDDTISDQDTEEAARLAHILDFIEELPEKWNTQVGERGIMLSGGQKQRIGIAMALARKPKIIIFDEATSALDNESEAIVKQAISNMKGKVTILAIAHRITTVLDADRIIALGGGGIIEEGVPNDLLSDPRSYLSKMQQITHS